MAKSVSYLLILCFLAMTPLCFAYETNYGGSLCPQFYDHSCPQAQEIVKSVVAKAVAREPRMAASLLRLLFHDCFVQGCDASLLLDSSGSIVSEKLSKPNLNSTRGFDVIDEIKAAVENACPNTVSCADILVITARDSVVLAGGPYWEVALGRRDSTTASLTLSNQNIPPPTSTFQTLVKKFQEQGLNVVDLVALSGSHTIGNARCVTFRERLYNQSGTGKPDPILNEMYASELRMKCPRSGGDDNLAFLDICSPVKFDNEYYKNLMANVGLLNSDEVLFTQSMEAMELVKQYAANNDLFLQHYVNSIIKMGSISPLTGSQGEIRENCRRFNSNY